MRRRAWAATVLVAAILTTPVACSTIEAAKEPEAVSAELVTVPEQVTTTTLRALSPEESVAFWHFTATDEQRQAFLDLVAPTTTTTTPPTTAPPARQAPSRAAPAPKTTQAAPQGGGGNNSGFLGCVKNRESRGQYGAVNGSSGAAGAYQFMPQTWNNTARHAGRPDLVGRNPASVSPADQDAMAQHLYQWQGAAPWGGGC